MARDANNYDLLRLLLALAVIFGHAGALNPRPGYIDPIHWLIGFDYSGGLAVKVFFFLSGLFVTDSMMTTRSAVRFAVMRAARLFPGLFVCLIVTSLIVGPLFTGLPVLDYLRNPLTFHYIATNLALTDLQWRLPGVFTESRYGVNGSLWTLPIEIRLYVVVGLLSLLGTFVRRSSATLAIALLAYFVLIHPDLPFGGLDAQGPVLCFLGGMAAAVHKRDLPLHAILALIIWLCALAAWGNPPARALFYCAVVYSALCVFQSPPLLRLRLPGDFSYGIYVYGFVVQQAFAALFPTAHPLVDALVCMPIATAVAVSSWFLVERPALSTARRLLAVWQLTRIDARSVWIGGAWVGVAAIAVLLPRVLPLPPGSEAAVAASHDLRVVSYGPASVTQGVDFNTQPDGSSAIWVRLSRPVAPTSEIHLGTDRLPSVAVGDLVTAKVPDRIFAAAGNLDLRVVEQVGGRLYASEAVPWEVR
ncbi:acyltransferase family protein [Rhodopila sp.]|uniref:acyltransferase family protein n=1 Tax=Rhodopila sp. TaxID=2480087 RepID=UPI003D110C4C